MRIRTPAVAGLFYPETPSQLANTVDQLLQSVSGNAAAPVPRALVVPHAGYPYSGQVAAAAYASLTPDTRYHYILLLGPSHRVPFNGLAVPTANSFSTPLGNIPLATEQIDDWVNQGLVEYNDLAHQFEHCLEVQLPFLQRSGIDAPLIPVVIGNTTPQHVASLITPTLNDPSTLAIITTDLSHYHSYAQAQRIDADTCQQIAQGSTQLTGQQACGYMGLNGLQQALKSSRLKTHLLSRCNSGDQTGDKARVVGYAAYAIY